MLYGKPLHPVLGCDAEKGRVVTEYGTRAKKKDIV